MRDGPIPAGLLLRLWKDGGRVVCGAARKPGGTVPVSQAGWFKPEEAFTASFESVPDASALLPWIESEVQTLVVVDAGLTWRELLGALEPLIERRRSFDLCLARSGL